MSNDKLTNDGEFQAARDLFKIKGQQRDHHIESMFASICGRIHNLENQVSVLIGGTTKAGGTVAVGEAGTVEAPLLNRVAPQASVPDVAPQASVPDTAPVATAAPVTPDTAPVATAAPAGDLDDEGVPWSEEFHSKAKSLVESTVVKGGKAWRLKRGVDKEAVEKYKSQFTAPAINTPQAAAPGVPDTAPEAAAPSVPGVPGAAPALQPTTSHEPLKKEIIGIIHNLHQQFGVSFEDCKTILEEEFKAAQNGEDDQIIFGSLREDQYQPVLDYFKSLQDGYQGLNNMVNQIYQWGGPANQASIDQGKAFYLPHGIGGVFYQDLTEKTAAVSEWHKQWADWAKSQGVAQ